MRSISKLKRVLLHSALTLCCLVATSTLLTSQNFTCGANATPTVMAGYVNRLANLSTSQPPQLPPNGMTYTIPIHVWVSKPSFDLESLYTTINQVNSTFSFSNGARFEICKVSRITDFQDVDLRNGTQHQSLYNTHNTPNMINLYFVDKISDSAFPLQSWGGFAKFPFDLLEVVVVSSFLPTIISHELGHFFGLLHTHDDTGGFDKEFVTRLTSEGANCSTVQGVGTGKADRLCETAADPFGLSGNTCLNGSACSFYDGNIRPRKPLGDIYTPPYDNIMSYHLNTANQFVAKQQQIMNVNLANYTNRSKYLTMTPCAKTTTGYGNIYRFCQESYPPPPLSPTYAVEKNLYLQNYSIGISNQSGATVGSTYFLPISGSGDYYYSNDVPLGNISISPSKYNDWLNGVTTFDISLISRHTLGIQTFSFPFTKIAADVNNDGQIAGDDMLHLRNLILRKIDVFPNNVGSYRFVPNAYLQSPSFVSQFNNDPFTVSWTSNGQTKTYLTNSYMDKADVDASTTIGRSGESWQFLPIKVGDVNCSMGGVSGVSNRMASPQSRYQMNTTISNNQIKKQRNLTLALKAQYDGEVSSYQIGINLSPTKLQLKKVLKGDLKTASDEFDSDIKTNGEIRALWYDNKGKNRNFTEGVTLMKIKVKSVADIQDILNDFKLDDALVQNNFYDENGNTASVKLTLEIDNGTEVEDNPYTVKTYPNPFKNELTFEINASKSEDAVITIYNAFGSVLSISKRNLSEGVNVINISNTNSFSMGSLSYTIKTPTQLLNGYLTKAR